MAYALPNGDWFNSLDIRPARIKESRVIPPPVAWIENCSNNNDVLKHLVSLRCFMLEDALSIQKINGNGNGNDENVVEDATQQQQQQPILMEL